jgi:DNA mismatch endonuclease (patch repair protein)
VADTRTPEQRSRIMAAVKGKNTAPELALRRGLHAQGVRGWRCHYKRAPGTPDLAWPGLRVAVFVDGAFWHGHPSRHQPGRSGEFWDDKIARNVERDRAADAALAAAGWIVVRAWDFEVRGDLDSVVARVIEALTRRARGGSRWQRDLVKRLEQPDQTGGIETTKRS